MKILCIKQVGMDDGIISFRKDKMYNAILTSRESIEAYDEDKHIHEVADSLTKGVNDNWFNEHFIIVSEQ